MKKIGASIHLVSVSGQHSRGVPGCPWGMPGPGTARGAASELYLAQAAAALLNSTPRATFLPPPAGRRRPAQPSASCCATTSAAWGAPLAGRPSPRSHKAERRGMPKSRAAPVFRIQSMAINRLDKQDNMTALAAPVAPAG